MKAIHACLIAGLSPILAHAVTFTVADCDGVPIPHAVVTAGEQFAYTDSLGRAALALPAGNVCHVGISHISYEPWDSIVGPDDKHATYTVTLGYGFHPLKEVAVSNRTPMQWVGDAIARIPGRYHLPLDTGVAYRTTINMMTGDNEPLIDYAGILSFRTRGKGMQVADNPAVVHVSPLLADYVYTVKPHEITDIMGLRNHLIIRDHKRYTYDNLEWISYRGVEAVKIGFHQTKNGVTQEGYLVISVNDLAIRHISYTVSPIKDWIGEKTQRGFTKTSLNDYYIASEFDKDETGKYTFVGGTKKIALTMKTGKTCTGTSMHVNLTAAPFHDLYPNWRPLKDLFASK